MSSTRRGGGLRSLKVFIGSGLGWWREVSPPQLLVGSFAALILLGTLGFQLLPGLYTGEPLGWLDSLFTATSAVCITGLIVVDTATYFTFRGQLYILLLVQLGGLGIITFTTLIIIALGRRLSLRQEIVSASQAEVAPHVDFRHLTRDILLFTFLLEAAGAALLWVAWAPDFGMAGAVWPAVFHAVSAFCNAGFSIFTDSLTEFRTQPLVLLPVMALIVVGGIGFLTMEELYLRGTWRRRRRQDDPLVPRLSLHSRLVLVTTAVLILGGGLFFTAYEWHVTLADVPWWSRVTNGFFMSVSARTAGFNTIDYGSAADGTNFLTILLMSIGGSPGSTAGGLKTTTFAVIGLLAWARLRGQRHVSLFGRTVPDETVQRAVGLFVVAFGLVTLAIFIMTTTEIGAVAHVVPEAAFLRYMFEAASAFNTVGLSMGVTPELSPGGRGLAVLLMYLGRVGPLMFAAAIALPSRRRSTFRYAHEDVVIG
jgi:trk system potassium uptake protein